MVIRNHYRFSRPLSAPEIELLTTLICWRNGSSVVTVGDAVVGCVAHPDDVVEFEKRLRRRGAKLEAIVLICNHVTCCKHIANNASTVLVLTGRLAPLRL